MLELAPPSDANYGRALQLAVRSLAQLGRVDEAVGRVQAEGGPIREIRPGDVVWIPPGEKHWHGASPTNGMTHIAMQEALDGNYATWMEKVTDAEYSAKVG